LGIVSTTIEDVTGWSPPFLTDPGWAKFAVILVNLWLTYPYFMLVCSGALQAIPTAIYEAAEVDGANTRQKFLSLTLPLLLVSVGPLLIASFTFNFNNFLLIEGLQRGGPPMIGTSAPPVGHTDNLISYTFRFAFGAGGTRDYGFASAIAIIIFIVVGVITLIQFRLTKRLEEIGENV
jgi:ABC-type sugar transport system permease subunit